MNEFQRCVNCAHWSQQEKTVSQGKRVVMMGLGECTLAQNFWDSTDWDDGGEKLVFTPEVERVHHFTQDGSDYIASLLTRPTFGCASFQAAPTVIGHRLSLTDRVRLLKDKVAFDVHYWDFKAGLEKALGVMLFDPQSYEIVSKYLDTQDIPYSTPVNLRD